MKSFSTRAQNFSFFGYLDERYKCDDLGIGA